MEEVLQELVIHSESDMEPEDDAFFFFMPDGDDLLLKVAMKPC